MATREEALARLNNIKQQRQQNVQERYNNIIRNNEIYKAQQQQLQEQQRLEERKKQENEEKQREQELQQTKQQASKISALSKQYNTNQGLNKSKINLPPKKNNIKIKTVTPENLSKDLNISKEEAQKKYEKMIQPPTTWQKVTNTAKNAGENTLEKFGIYNLVENSKETAKGLREAMWQDPIIMGVRGGVAGIVDSVTTEGASLFNDYESGILTEYLKGNPIYNIANTAKNVYGTAKDIKENGGDFVDIAWGAGSKLATETLNNTLNVIGGKSLYNTGQKIAQKVTNSTLSEEQRESAQKTLLNTTQSYYKDKEKYEKLQQNESKGWQYANDVLEGTGRMVPGITATMITGNPTIGLGTTGLSVKGSSTQEALQKGATLDEAIQTGNLKAVVEMATEKVSSGLKIFGKGITDDIIEDLIVNKIKNKALQWGAKTIAGVVGEISEEIISDVAGSVVDRGIYDEKAKLPTLEDMKETAKVTAGTTLLLNGLTGGISSNSTNNTQNTVSNIEQNPTQTPNNVQNLQQNAVKNQSNVQQQQISQIENKNGLNQNVEGQTETKFSKILNNKKLPMQSYMYEKSDNIKIDNLRKQANKMFNNSQEAHNYVGMLEKIITDKNVEIVLDANLKDENGNLANGKYENGVITINPNSNRVGEFIAIHELTHAIGTKALRKIVDEYRKSNPEFDKAVQKLLSNYNQTEITGEALSDVCAQLFGNQEYINNLATKNPNLFRKIYSEIKYLWHQFNGYKNKEQFVEDLMFKWEQAYRKNAKLNNKTGYSFAGENAKIANFKNLDFAKQMEQQGKTAQEIFEQTGWYKGNEGKWRFEIDDSNWNIKDIKIDKNTIYDLEDLLDAPELYEAYPKLKKVPVYFESEMKENGSYTKADNWYDQIYINSDLLENTDAKSYSMLGLKNQDKLFSTLQHEIQHYIQDKENFSKGASVEYWESKTKDISRKINQIQSDFDYYNKLIGLDKYIEEISEKQSKGEIEITEVPTLIDGYIEKKGYTKIYNTLQTRLQDLRKDDSNYSKQNPYTLYRNTAGEQEARNVQNRIKLSSGEKKNTLPFIKDENTVYAKDSNESFSQKKDIIKITQNILDGLSKSKINGKIVDILNNKVNKMDFYVDNIKIIANSTTIGKLREGNIKFDKRIPKNFRNELKANIFNNMKDIVENSNVYKPDTPDIKEHTFADTFDKRKSLFKYKDNNYIITFNVGKKNGRNTLYGIDSIKLTQKNKLSFPKTNENLLRTQKSTGPTKLISSIAQNKKSVNKNMNLPTKNNLDTRYSKDNTSWQQYLEKEFPAKGTTTNFQDIKLPTKENASTQKTSNKQEQQNINLPLPKNKTLNPTEIANLKQEDANTTVKLPQKESKQGNRVSNFFGNVTQDAQFLNEDLRKQISQDDGVIYYQGVTNEQTLNQAFKELQDGGSKATLEWFNQDSKKATAKDTAKGWILLKQYQDAGDYQSAVEVAKKMREIGTNAGQTVQAFNILSRLTPEGMVYYAQSELSEAYEAMVKNKSKDWIDKNVSSFDLTPQETQFIMDTMEEVGKMEDGYDKKVKLAEIQKIITDKIPPTKGQSIKAWMRISMLFNPKTQVRNIAGNAIILPVNAFGDMMSSTVDKLIAKKTGVRTTGTLNVAQYAKGFKKGLFESFNDFRKGINTRNIEGNRFEIKEGRSFKNKGIGKALNKVDNILSFMLDAGDRGFYEATFTNSINNQLVLNKTTEVTQDMIDIATNEALQRTWQDNNGYTRAVLSIRKMLSKLGIEDFGMGDVIIPFAKTPANLTKALYDYSPVGLAKTITRDAMIFNRSLSNGQYSPQLQHKFVQNLGKGMAGTALYVLGYALAKAGIASGEPDDDKDVKNFMKNSLGISSYSIKIGDKSFTFDWAQPVATPLAIMTNYVKYSEDNPDAKAIEKALQSINIGTEQLLQQSFMESLNTVLNGNGTFVENLSQAVLDLPARAIPTFSKQIADMVDGTQRTTFEYNQPLQSAVNSVKAKIPGLSKTLPPSIDTLGNEIQKYGGENNIFNVFFNPANVNKGELSKAGEEIYELYKETGNTAIFPRTAPYYMNNDGEKINMTAETRAEFQEVSGKYVEKSIEKLLKNKEYKKLSDSKKAELIEEIVSDSYNQAKYEVLDIESKTFTKTRQLIEKVGVADYYDFVMKTADIEGTGAEKKKIQVLANANYSNEHKEAIYEIKMGSDDELYNTVMKNTGINMTEYLNYKSQTFSADKKDDGTVDGKSISGSKKKKVYTYVNNMKITGNQRLLLLGTQYKLTNSERIALAEYVKSLKITNKEKLAIYDKLQGFTVYKNGRVTF